jgi:lysozyme
VEPTDAQIRALGGIDVLFKKIRKWLDIVESRCGKRPILYVNQMFVNKYLVNADDIKKKYQVWIARYGEYRPDVRLVFWQLSPDGRVSGITPLVDINVFNGDREQFEEFATSQAPCR